MNRNTAAREPLAITFSESDRERMRDLAAKARAGMLTAAEKEEINVYERTGQLIDLLQSSARQILRHEGT